MGEGKGGVGERSTKKYSRKGKLNEWTPSIPSKYSCTRLKKFIQEEC